MSAAMNIRDVVRSTRVYIGVYLVQYLQLTSGALRLSFLEQCLRACRRSAESYIQHTRTRTRTHGVYPYPSRVYPTGATP